VAAYNIKKTIREPDYTPSAAAAKLLFSRIQGEELSADSLTYEFPVTCSF